MVTRAAQQCSIDETCGGHSGTGRCGCFPSASFVRPSCCMVRKTNGYISFEERKEGTVELTGSLGYSLFLPTIIKGLGTWTVAEVQLLTIPCYFVGATTFIVVAYLSDRLQRRGIFCVICGSNY